MGCTKEIIIHIPIIEKGKTLVFSDTKQSNQDSYFVFEKMSPLLTLSKEELKEIV